MIHTKLTRVEIAKKGEGGVLSVRGVLSQSCE